MMWQAPRGLARLRSASLHCCSSFSSTFAFSLRSSSNSTSVLSNANPNTALQQEQRRSPVERLLQEKLGYSDHDIAKIHRRCSQLSKARSTRRADDAIHLFSNHGLTRKQLAKFILDNPELLCFRAEECLKPRLQVLKSLGFTGEALAHVISRGGRVLSSKDLSGRINAFQALVGDQVNLPQILLKCPRLLAFSVEKAQTLVELMKQSGMSDASTFALISGDPEILSRSPCQMRSAIEYLRNLGVPAGSKTWAFSFPKFVKRPGNWKERERVFAASGFGPDQIQQLLRKKPDVVIYPGETLKRKLQFLTDSGGISADSLVGSPALLCYSLEKRLKPRYEIYKYLKASGCTVGCLPEFFMIGQQRWREKYVKGRISEAKLVEIMGLKS